SSIHTPSLIGTYSLSLHDALPIYVRGLERPGDLRVRERAASVSRMVARAVCEARIKAVGEWPGTMAQLGYPPPDFRAHRLRSSKDRKSTRLNSSYVSISYAVFCLK